MRELKEKEEYHEELKVELAQLEEKEEYHEQLKKELAKLRTNEGMKFKKEKSSSGYSMSILQSVEKLHGRDCIHQIMVCLILRVLLENIKI